MSILRMMFVLCLMHLITAWHTKSSWAQHSISETALVSKPVGTQKVFPETPKKIGQAETTLSISLLAQVYPPSLGGESIAVFQDVQSNKTARKKYYALPYFMIKNADEFSQTVIRKCSDAEDDLEVTAPLRFEIASKAVNQEIVQELSQDLKISDPDNAKEVTLGQLHPYPFVTLMVLAGASTDSANNPAKALYTYPIVPKTLEDDIVQARTVSFPTQLNERSIVSRGSCGLLLKAVETGDISAHVLTPFDRTSTASFSLNYNALWSSGSYQRIFLKSSQSGEISNRIEAGGANANFNLIDIGVTERREEFNNTQSDTRHRIVSGDVIERAASEFLQNAYFESYVRASENDIADKMMDKVAYTNAHLEKLVKMITEFSEKITVDVKNWNTENAQLYRENVIGYSLNKNQVKRINEASNKLKLSRRDATKGSVAYSGFSASGSRDANNAADSDQGIKLEFDGTDWVPVSVNLNRISDARASGMVRIGVRNVQAVTSKDLQLIMLPKIIREGEPTVFQPPLSELEPRKMVIPLVTGPLSTVQFVYTKYSNGRENDGSGSRVSSAVMCTDPPSLPSGFVQIGGKVVLKIDGGCLSEDDCSGSHVVRLDQTNNIRYTETYMCRTRMVESGCFVNREWVEWYELSYRKRDDAKNLSNEMLCDSSKITD